VKRDKVAVHQALDNFKPVLMRLEMCRTWEGRVEEQPNVCMLEALLDVKGDHQQVVVVDPDCLGSLQRVLHIDDLLSYFLVD
jgi:hypothetical protein